MFCQFISYTVVMTVILLHGLGRTARSMSALEHVLSAKGYDVMNLNYPSRTAHIEQLVTDHLAPVIEKISTDPNTTIHFVTHSMGGIMVRHYLANHPLPNLGRIVMLAPPNQGSHLATKISTVPFSQKIFGPALKQLAHTPNSFVHTLPQSGYQVGVIAGKYDGKVSVDDTKLENMTDFLVVPKTHTWIMHDPKVIQAISTFLKTGKFTFHT